MLVILLINVMIWLYVPINKSKAVPLIPGITVEAASIKPEMEKIKIFVKLFSMFILLFPVRVDIK